MGKSDSLKSAAVVFGALAFGWLTIELAFRPLLEKARSALDKSDPTHDPDETTTEKISQVESDDDGGEGGDKDGGASKSDDSI